MSLFKHTHEHEIKPERVVILGAFGVIGKSLCQTLKENHISFLALGRKELDLLEKGASQELASLLHESDSLVFLSTLTPDKGKGVDAFMKNVAMAETVCNALAKKTISHLIYLSSDTVYPLNKGIVSEETLAEPENLYGIMHLSREYMLKASTSAPLAILRSTLVYAAADTHNSYGPNRMRRAAHTERKISLFGKGEEKRDHICVDDIASLIYLTLMHRSQGILNLATGHSISYFELAKKIAAVCPYLVEVACTERANPITHRHFDVSLLFKAFPTFCFKSLDEGLREAQEKEYDLAKRT